MCRLAMIRGAGMLLSNQARRQAWADFEESPPGSRTVPPAVLWFDAVLVLPFVKAPFSPPSPTHARTSHTATTVLHAPTRPRIDLGASTTCVGSLHTASAAGSVCSASALGARRVAQGLGLTCVVCQVALYSRPLFSGDAHADGGRIEAERVATGIRNIGGGGGGGMMAVVLQ